MWIDFYFDVAGGIFVRVSENSNVVFCVNERFPKCRLTDHVVFEEDF